MDGDGLTVVPEAAIATSDDLTGRAAPFRALNSVPFRWYFAGQIASASGTFVQQTAVGWLVLSLTGSAGALGLTLAAGGLPPLLFGPWGGAIADRLNLRRLLLLTQLLLGLSAAMLWLLSVSGRASVGAVIAIMAASGVVTVVDMPARQAFIAALVPPADLSSAVSLNGVVMNTAKVVGPAVAGLLIIAGGTSRCFAVNAASYLAIIVALLLIGPVVDGAVRGRAGGVREGLAYARRDRALWLPLAMMAIVGLLAFNFLVVLPVFAKDTFHGSGGTYGMMSTLLSIGAIGGSLSVGALRTPRQRHLVFTVGAFGLGLGLTAAAPTLQIACTALVFTGMGAFSFVTLCTTMLQLHAEPAYRGRVMALWVYVFIGTTPIGSVITGWVINAWGARAALIMGAASCAAAAAIAVSAHPTESRSNHTDVTGSG